LLVIFLSLCLSCIIGPLASLYPAVQMFPCLWMQETWSVLQGLGVAEKVPC
jgi:hypothetical protein